MVFSFAELCEQVGGQTFQNFVRWLRRTGLLQSFAVCGFPANSAGVFDGCGTLYDLKVPIRDETTDPDRRTKCPNQNCKQHKLRVTLYTYNSIFYNSNLRLVTQVKLLHCFANSKSNSETRELIGRKFVSKNTISAQFEVYRQAVNEYLNTTDAGAETQLGGVVEISNELRGLCEQYKQVVGQAKALHSLEVSHYRVAKSLKIPVGRPEPRREIYQRLLSESNLPELPLEATSVQLDDTRAGKVVEVDEARKRIQLTMVI